VVTSAPTVTILSNDTTINSGEIVNVIANGSGTPIWSPATGVSNPTSFSTVIQPNESGYYTITVSDVSGCMGMDSILITVKDPVSDLFISNAITPNNDGFNDEFVVEGIIDNQKNTLKIFNEYGHLVFSASPYKNDWKGTYNNSRLPDGTYFYVLEFTDLKKVFKGSITLMSQN
jgi:gliding motility-associated-like protein